MTDDPHPTTGTPCHHHAAVLAGLAHIGHLDDQTTEQVRADLARQCCDHPRASRTP